MEPLRFASLDLGTNTFRLLIAEAAAPENDVVQLYGGGKVRRNYRVLARQRAMVRSGGGFTSEHGISSEAIGRILDALRSFRAEMDEHGVRHYRAAATSVFRRAVNSPQIFKDIYRETGFEIPIITGDEEAELSARGALTELSAIGADGSDRATIGPAIVFDIGGGSTEFIFVEQGRIVFRQSVEIGVVSLVEEIFRTEADEIARRDEGRRRIARELGTIIPSLREKTAGRSPMLVGTAGTISTVAAVDLGLSVYDRERINGHRLRRSSVAGVLDRLADLPRSERVKVPGLEKGREDLIVPGCLIALEAMESLACDTLTVSEGGLLEGLMHWMVNAEGVAAELRG